MACDRPFNGRSALVTGAASGIGAACARWLAAQGIARLVLVDRNAGGLARLDLDCTVETYAGDVSDPDFICGLALESLDHAVLSAGVAGGGPITGIDFAEWRRVMAVNLDGAFLSLQAAMRAMSEGGSVVLLSSVSGLKPMAGAAAYGASKAAIAHLAKVAALEGAERHIRVNAIAPGGVDTPIWDGEAFFDSMVAEMGREAAIAAMASATPSKRFASADEIAATIGFLLSDEAANVTGTVLVSDGGFSL